MLYVLQLVSSDHIDFVRGFEQDGKQELILDLIYRVQITFQLGCEQRKTPTENYVEHMTKILRNAQCLLLGLMDLTLFVRVEVFDNATQLQKPHWETVQACLLFLTRPLPHLAAYSD